MVRVAELAVTAVACSALLAACASGAGETDAAATEPRHAAPQASLHAVADARAVATGRPRLALPGPPGTPLRWVLVGDSVAYSLVPTLEVALADVAALHGRRDDLREVIVGPGLGITADRPGHNDLGPAPPHETFASWRDEVASALDVHRPHVVVVLLGVWDTIDRDVGGVWRAPGQPEWARWYRSEVDRTLRLARRSGAVVAWVLMPCTSRPEINARLHHVNATIRASARREPRSVTTIDLEPVACDGGAPITTATSAGRSVTLRMRDGVHFDGNGARVVLRPWIAGRLEAALRGGRAPRMVR